MRFRILIGMGALLGAAALAATPAAAKFVRFPESGKPAWEVHVPEEWVVKKGVNQNLMAFSPDTRARLVVQVLPSEGSLDEFATIAMNVAHADGWKKKRPITISGFKGFDYFSAMGNSHGNRFNIEMMIVRIDAAHVGVCDLLIDVGISGGEMAAGHQIVGALKIVK